MGNSHRGRQTWAGGTQSSRLPSPAMNRQNLYKVSLAGDLGTGKTSVHRRLGGQYHCVYHVGGDFSVRYICLDDVQIKVSMLKLDTFGQERFGLAAAHYRGALGIIIFYNALRKETFDNVPYWIEEARKYSHSHATTLMLVGTKCERSKEKVVTYETAKDFADKNDMLFFEVSAKDGTNIELALLTLVAEIRRKHCELELTTDHSVV